MQSTKTQRTLASVLPTIAKATAIEEYCESRYIDTHTIINMPNEDESCLQLCGSERHAEISTDIDPNEPVKISGNIIEVKDTHGNPLELRLFTLSPLMVK